MPKSMMAVVGASKHCGRGLYLTESGPVNQNEADPPIPTDYTDGDFGFRNADFGFRVRRRFSFRYVV
jgi:hypothetical protein